MVAPKVAPVADIDVEDGVVNVGAVFPAEYVTSICFRYSALEEDCVQDITMVPLEEPVNVYAVLVEVNALLATVKFTPPTDTDTDPDTLAAPEV
jgi:hypothetical protein